MTNANVPISEVIAGLNLEDANVARQTLAGGVRIPPQPRVLEELRQHLERREFDIRQLSKVIRQDPGVVAMLFKVVGSATFKQHQPFDSIEQVLHTVGVKQTYNMVRAICLIGDHAQSANRAALEAFWSRSQTIAHIAMLVANDRVTVCNIFPDQAYLAGIFHDCGVPLLMNRFDSYCQEMHLNEPGTWIDLQKEDKRFNTDHCVIGYLVARHWNLPTFICDAIRYHHDIVSIESYAARSMVAIIQLSVEIYSRYQGTSNQDWSIVSEEVLGELCIHQDGLPEYVDVILEQYQDERQGAL